MKGGDGFAFRINTPESEQFWCLTWITAKDNSRRPIRLKYFESAGSIERVRCTSNGETSKITTHNVECRTDTRLIHYIFVFSTVSEQTIEKVKSNACGHDLISFETVLSVYYSFLNAYNKCLVQPYFSVLWRSAIAIPIQNISNPFEFKKLRFVCISPVMSKILEKICF